MSLLKQKNQYKKYLSRLRPWHVSRRALRIAEPLFFVIGIMAVAVCLQIFMTKPAAKHATPKKTHSVAVSRRAAAKPKAKTTAAAPSNVTSPSTQTSTKTATTPTATVTPKPAPAGTSKTEPVVTPSPASSVSGLSPTAPATTATPSGSQQVTSGYTSTNWSGYMATNGTFTAVSGSWHATTVSGNGSTTSADSTWIGIGGVTSSDLIQVGTQNIVSANGQVTSSAFYELLPSYAVTVPGVTVSQGDSMSASITETGGSIWKISITDNTDGQSFTITVSYASSLSSAEWIEEDPSYSARRQIPFDTFQAAYFAGVATTEDGVATNLTSSTAQPVIMVNSSGQFIAVPSVIGSDGASFSVTP